MKSTKLPQQAKQSLFALLIFAAIVMVFRHLVADQQQERRIELLEIQTEQLQAQLEAQSQVLLKTKREHTDYSAPRPAKQMERKGTSTPSATPRTKTEVLVEKLTETTKSDKFTTPILLELNTVDSVTLIKVPGIASKTAHTILIYRQQLGGFYSPEQLRDRLTWDAAQDYMDEWCAKWFKADESLVQMLHVNSLSFKEINHHPYINYEQTKAIKRYIDKHNGIHSMAELEQLGVFDEETLGKLEHYISFE